MQILAACLCDSAADYQGKLCILGAFDTVVAAAVPTVHPTCSIAIRFLSRSGDEGHHQIRLALIDADGRDALPSGAIKVDFDLPPMPEGRFFSSNNVVLNLQGVTLGSYAVHSFDIYFDGEIAARLPLQVIRPPAAPR